MPIASSGRLCWRSHAVVMRADWFGACGALIVRAGLGGHSLQVEIGGGI
jgi:hypothetical protein